MSSSEITNTSDRRSFAKTTIAAEMYCPACDRSYSELEQRCPHDGANLVRLSGTIDSLEGRTLDGRFTLLRRLGRGGMGAVYGARQLSIGRNVAVKVIKPEIGADLYAARRFLREARLASRLTSPHSVGVLEFGQSSDGLLYLVMELLQGRTLAQLLRDEGPLPPGRVAGIGVQLCDALHAAHDHHIVHRDLKPSNIIVLDEPSDRDFVKVLDFGLAKSLAGDTTTTQSGQLMGTPTYIAPETIIDGTVDPRSDLYALGVILFELCTGAPPFTGDNINTLLLQHAYKEPPALPPVVPEALASVVTHLLDKDLNARYATAAETRAALEAVAANLGGRADATPPPARAPAPRFPTQVVPPLRPRVPVLKLAAVVAAIGAVVAAIALVPRLAGSRAAEEPASAADTRAAGAAGAAEAAAAPETGETPGEAEAEPPDLGAQLAAGAQADAGSAAAEPATIELSLRSTPRARVFVDGAPRGRTPLDLEMAAGSEPVQVEFRRRGRRSVTRTVRPDRSHSLDVMLPRVRQRPSGRPTRQSPRDDPPDLPF